MDLRIFTEPQQGATYDDLLRVALEAERLGFSAFFRSDHYLTMGGDGLPGPSDAWITLAGLARDTSTIRLGTLMTSATFRHPGPLAIAVAGVDQMSGGRVELGLGAGWYEPEHTAYGIPFRPTKARFEVLEEQLAIITGLWETPAGEKFSYSGKHYTLTDSPALPKPAQSPRPPIIIGGKGPRRTPALAAAYADEFNLLFAGLEDGEEQIARIRTTCAEADRDPDSLIYSASVAVCVGEDRSQFLGRAEAIGREPEELLSSVSGTVAGTVAEARVKVESYARFGITRLYLQVLDLTDLDHLALIARELMG
ncbi:MAG: LLM class F420-dependent oxidoreductase [Nocardioidaceae bacterium]|nr:MAG: LLM class F420-dependent oxidoreductase [Nocardioidaceae bacterium]